MQIEKRPIVSVARNENITQAVNLVLDQLSIPDLTGKTVLLKPNVGREADPRSGVNTNPDVVRAVFNYLKKRFKAKFLIGDSPIINTDTRNAFKQSGFSELINDPEIHFVDLDSKPFFEVDIPNGKILKKIKLTGYLNEIDYIVSIPVLKMHMHTGASLSFKNLKGLIYKRNKITLHHLQAQDIINELLSSMKHVKELDVAISDLAQVIKPDLAVIDASYAQEGMGPSSGNAVKLDTIIASTNFLAADIIIQEFIHPLEPPPSSISIKYKNVNLIDIDSCSACLSTIFNLLKNNKDFIDQHFSPKKPLNIAIGKGIKQSDLYSDTYLIGNCTYHQQENGIFVKGCTPVESTILSRIKENLKLN